MRMRTVRMLEIGLVVVAAAGLFLHTFTPALAASDAIFTPDEQQQLERLMNSYDVNP